MAEAHAGGGGKKHARRYDGCFRVAAAFGLDPFDVLSRWTDRQLQAALTWLSEQWNKPDLVCHYLMALRADVVRGYAKTPASVRPDRMRLKFVPALPAAGQAPAVSKEQASLWSKLRWGARLGLPAKTFQQPHPGGGSQP